MKVFLFDYASGGGLGHLTLESSLLLQGDIIIRALLADLSIIPDVEVTITSDVRLSTAELARFATVVRVSGQFEATFDACVDAADAVWLIAPEADGILESLSRKVLLHKRILLGSSPEAVRVSASKLETVRALVKAGIRTVDTYTKSDTLPNQSASSAWVVKPDKGAGCRDTRIFSSPLKALAWIGESGENDFVMQPFISGQPCSLSLICYEGVARVLSYNKQRIAVRDNQLYFLGSTINSFTDTSGELEQMAQKIAAILPGFWGFVGVDFILTETGPVVLELNPQMTTSCAGLRASIGCNPVALVMDLLRDTGSALLLQKVLKADPVSVDIAAFDGL